MDSSVVLYISQSCKNLIYRLYL